MNVLDLFSGIGGFSLGLERAGMRTVGFCEIDPYCQRVLRKHWPDVPIWDDVRTLDIQALGNAAKLQVNGRSGEPASRNPQVFEFGNPGSVDVICGGFPCQDISAAGKGAGIEGERSGLWSEYARIIGEVRPKYVIVENVAALLGRGLSRVLGDLAALGYDAEWHCIPASAVGAPHRRDRVWIIAYPSDSGRRQLFQSVRQCGSSIEADIGSDGKVQHVADSDAERCGWGADNKGPLPSIGRRIAEELISYATSARPDWWESEPDVGRVAHGVPLRVDRLRALGNSIVPQIAEIIGRAIMKKAPVAGG